MQTYRVICSDLLLICMTPWSAEDTWPAAEATICSQESKSSNLNTCWRIVRESYRQKQFDSRWNQLTSLPPASKFPCFPCQPTRLHPTSNTLLWSFSFPPKDTALALRKTASLAQEFTPFEARWDICTSKLFCWALCYHWQALLRWLTSLHILRCCVLP